MRKLTRSILATTAVAGLLALPIAGASADSHTATQDVTGSVDPTVTIQSSPAAAALGTLPTTGFAAGSVTVNANEDYTLTVVSDQGNMTLLNADGTYSATKLSTAMTMTSTSTDGTGLGTPAAISTTELIIGTGTGILSDTHTYDLTMNQDATALDVQGSYKFILTYTAAPIL